MTEVVESEGPPQKKLRTEDDASKEDYDEEEEEEEYYDEEEEDEDEMISDDMLPPELTRLFLPLECRLCEVKVTSAVTAYYHYNGKLHNRKIHTFLSANNLPTYFIPKKTRKGCHIYCEVCCKHFSSETHAQSHYVGKSHLRHKALADAKLRARTLVRGSLPVVEVAPLEPPPIPPTEYFCEICCISTTGAEQLVAHKKGTKHLKKVARLNHEPQLDLSLFRTPSDQYYCPNCNITSNSYDQFLQHIKSKKHKKKKS